MALIKGSHCLGFNWLIFSVDLKQTNRFALCETARFASLWDRLRHQQADSLTVGLVLVKSIELR